jgi:hypothetical protein
MRLTAQAIKAINTPVIRHELAGLFKCTEQTIIRYIHSNKVNGPLTTIGALLLIKKLTSLTDDQVLE